MDQIETIVRDGRRWWIRPGAAAALLAAGWPPGRPERLTVVKRGASRTVYRGEAPGADGAADARAFYVKVYAPSDFLRRWRARLGFGPGRREWEALLAARAAGLDVPEPIAFQREDQEILVTREIPDARRLDEYLFERYFEPLPGDPPYPGARPPELVSVFRRRRTPPEGTIDPPALAYALADLVSRLADADLYLPDLHPGNILVSGPPGAWRLSLVDLAEAERPAPSESVLKHLMQLEHFFEPVASVAERLRCLGRLRELMGGVPGARTVARSMAAYRQRFYRQRDRRTYRESKYFRRIAAGKWRGWATTDWADAVLALLAKKGSDPFSGAVPLKEGRTSSVWRVPLADGRSLIVKRHNRAEKHGLAHGVLAPSRSLAALRRGHALLYRGIATARPAAAADLRRGGTVRDTLYFSEPVGGAERLSDWLARDPPAPMRRHVTWLLARMIRRMHDAGFSHRDLKTPNILVSGAAGSEPRPFLVDLDGLRGVRRVSARRRARDLMRLSVSLDEWGVARRTDRLRFLRAYLGRRGCPAAIAVLHRRRGRIAAARRLRRWWQRIARLSERKLEALRRKQAFPG